MDVKMRGISTLKPYPKNPRQNDGAVDAVADSIKEFGFRQPIVVDEEGVILAGHTRHKAALKLGLERVPVHVAKGLSPQQVRAYRVADNKVAELASWDAELLPIELADLRTGGVDLESLGFTSKDLASLFNAGTKGKTDPDAVPEPPPKPITKSGDIWWLGEHRLLCGDAMGAGDVEFLMGDVRAEMLFTDPPYNTGKSWNGLQSFRGHQRVKNDNRSDWEVWVSSGLAMWMQKALDDFAGYWWFGNVANPRCLIEALGLKIRGTLVWVKEHFNVGRADYHARFERCQYFSRGERGWNGARDQGDVRFANRVEEKRLHPTQKPVSLCCGLIENHECKLVFDPFLGSGTTLIACEQLGRTAYAMEIEPEYCDIAVKRWEKFTGKKAKRERIAKKKGKTNAKKA